MRSLHTIGLKSKQLVLRLKKIFLPGGLVSVLVERKFMGINIGSLWAVGTEGTNVGLGDPRNATLAHT